MSYISLLLKYDGSGHIDFSKRCYGKDFSKPSCEAMKHSLSSENKAMKLLVACEIQYFEL